jgi:hypothetical protein
LALEQIKNSRGRWSALAVRVSLYYYSSTSLFFRGSSGGHLRKMFSFTALARCIPQSQSVQSVEPVVDFPTSPSSFSNLKFQILFAFSCGWFGCGYAALGPSVSITKPTAT